VLQEPAIIMELFVTYPTHLQNTVLAGLAAAGVAFATVAGVAFATVAGVAFAPVAGVAFATVACVAFAPAAQAQTDAAPSPRDVPARSIPVPSDVSPQMQKIIAAPLRDGWNTPPSTGEGWRKLADTAAAATIATLPAMRERLHVTVQPTTIDGVKAYIVTPAVIPPRNRNRLLIQVHGGCYVLGPGEAATTEAIMMAGFGHYKVISVDYRMPPDAYFPAALDDAMTVYKAALKMEKPKNIAILGTSAGGALTLEMVLRAKQLGLPMPGAIAPGTPMSDSTKVGDSFQTNKLVDNVLVSPDGFCHAAATFYANGHDMKDPLISPVYGDMHGFPPAILTTGTRDLLLSNTVRVHRKLREAGVDASLQVYEGESHAEYMRDDTAPETKEAFGEIASFFDTHLGR
jgi:epsilon-lactone hydrolase